MRAETRTIKASILAGLTEIFFGLIMYVTGWADWYFDKFHFFGIMGLCMIFYAAWHYVLLARDVA